MPYSKQCAAHKSIYFAEKAICMSPFETIKPPYAWLGTLLVPDSARPGPARRTADMFWRASKFPTTWAQTQAYDFDVTWCTRSGVRFQMQLVW
jgi:hypothetical protein